MFNGGNKIVQFIMNCDLLYQMYFIEKYVRLTHWMINTSLEMFLNYDNLKNQVISIHKLKLVLKPIQGSLSFLMMLDS